MQSLVRLLHRLADAGVDYVVIGGFAGVLHGSSLVTQDVDICTVLTPESVERLRDCLRELNPKHRMTPRKLSFLTHPAATGTLKNLYLETDWGTLDILTEVLGVGDFNRLNATAEEVEIFGRTIRVLSLGDLIAAKEALGRDKDRLAAKELRAIAEKRRARKR